MAKVKIATAKDIEFNRWCIEMAMKWPVVSSLRYGNQVGGAIGGYAPALDPDADVIGRAGKIAAWVKAAQ